MFFFNRFRICLLIFLSIFVIKISDVFSYSREGAKRAIFNMYKEHLARPSDINQHLPILSSLSIQCYSVIEIGLGDMISTVGIIKGLSSPRIKNQSYLGIKINRPNKQIEDKIKKITATLGIRYNVWLKNDLDTDIPTADMLFIDSIHTYCHLSYELEKFSPMIHKYIVMHDTSPPWDYKDDTTYNGNYSEYPKHINRSKRGLWPAVEDFLQKHPEWVLEARYGNNHGLTVLKRVSDSKLFFKNSKSPFPIQFSIPECKIVKNIPKKERDFAYIIPGQKDTYIYDNEKEYYKDYQRSYYAITCKKGGWDCLRHYEILANGCIPYFLDLNDCDPNTMYFLPKELIKKAMSLPGVSYLNIDHKKFDKHQYNIILKELLEHTVNHLSCKSMASYILNTINYKGKGKILFLSHDANPDYLGGLTLIGLKSLLKDRVVDFPKIKPIYKNYAGNVQNLYGKGISYTKIIDDYPLDRSNIEDRIKNREFDIIIYGGLIHLKRPFHDLVRQYYKSDEIIYFCGEDIHHCQFMRLPNLFLREFPIMKF
jgi:hypothetical protein